MASDCVDGDYLGAYRRFFEDFIASINPDDQLPVKMSGYDFTEGEIVGEIIDMTLQYLNQKYCPPSLQAHMVRLVIDEVKPTCKKQPEDCGLRLKENTYAPLRLMKAVTDKVNEICRRYLDNSRLALLPPPPSNPLPLATACAIKNTRRKMEDRHVILHDLHTIFSIEDDSIANYYAVFDGHAGQDAAVYCAAHLHQYLAESDHYPTDPQRALRDAFLTTDAHFVQKSKAQNLSSGTTAVCALILDRKLYIAWAGDSQATLTKFDSVTQLVNPHKPERNDERFRVEEMGGTVLHYGIWRVNGHLGVSRAIGDAQYKPFITGDPDIRCVTLDGKEDFLIIACDGLWDFVNDNEASKVIYQQIYQNPYNLEAVSQNLVQYAKTKGSCDNISVIVVFLTPPTQIVSRSPPYDHPLLADVHLNNMDLNNPFLSNANGQFDINAAIVKQQQQQQQSNGSASIDDDKFLYEKSRNGKHENGAAEYEDEDDDDDDDDDLGPETDVDAADEIENHTVNETVNDEQPAAAIFTNEIDSPEKKVEDRNDNPDYMQIQESEEIADTKPQNENALIPDPDNVADSEDSEDEWDYYRVDPNKEKNSAEAPEEVLQESEKQEGEEDTTKSLKEDCNSDIIKTPEPEGVEEIEQLKDDYNPETLKTFEVEEVEPIQHQDELQKPELIEDIESFEPKEEVLQLQNEVKPEEDFGISGGEEVQEKHEDMDSQLNPHAAEFFPVSPTSNPIQQQTRRSLLSDFPISGSPLKQTPAMDDITIPSEKEFEEEVCKRPSELEEKSCSNGDSAETQSAPDFPDFCSEKQKSFGLSLDESEISSTKAEFGDESILATSEFHRTGISTMDNSFAGSENYDIAKDPMAMSFTPCDFENVFDKGVDLNAVHDLSGADLLCDDSSTLVSTENVKNVSDPQESPANLISELQNDKENFYPKTEEPEFIVESHTDEPQFLAPDTNFITSTTDSTPNEEQSPSLEQPQIVQETMMCFEGERIPENSSDKQILVDTEVAKSPESEAALVNPFAQEQATEDFQVAEKKVEHLEDEGEHLQDMQDIVLEDEKETINDQVPNVAVTVESSAEPIVEKLETVEVMKPLEVDEEKFETEPEVETNLCEKPVSLGFETESHAVEEIAPAVEEVKDAVHRVAEEIEKCSLNPDATGEMDQLRYSHEVVSEAKNDVSYLSHLSASESMQEFTGLEQQLNPIDQHFGDQVLSPEVPEVPQHPEIQKNVEEMETHKDEVQDAEVVSLSKAPVPSDTPMLSEAADLEISAPLETSVLLDTSAPLETSELLDTSAPMETSELLDTSAPMESSELLDTSAPMETSELLDTSAPMEISTFFEPTAPGEPVLPLELVTPSEPLLPSESVSPPEASAPSETAVTPEIPVAVEVPKEEEKSNIESQQASSCPEPAVTAAAAAAATVGAVAAATATVAAAATKSASSKTKSPLKTAKTPSKTPAKTTPSSLALSSAKSAISAKSPVAAKSPITATKKSTTTSSSSPGMSARSKADSSSKPSSAKPSTAKAGTAATASKTSRVSSSSTLRAAKPAATLTAKSSVEKKPVTTNGDVVGSNKLTTAAKTKAPSSTTATRTTNLVKSAPATKTTTSSSLTKSKATTTGAKPASAVSRTAATTAAAARPKTAPASSTDNKTRVNLGTRSSITDKQMKETTNKEISSARTSGVMKSTTTRTSTTTSSSVKRVASSTLTSTTTAASAKSAVGAKKLSNVTSKVGSKPPAKAGSKAIAVKHKTSTTTTTTTAAVQNGVSECTKEIKATNEEDIPKKDVSPITEPTDNQLVEIAE